MSNISIRYISHNIFRVLGIRISSQRRCSCRCTKKRLVIMFIKKTTLSRIKMRPLPLGIKIIVKAHKFSVCTFELLCINIFVSLTLLECIFPKSVDVDFLRA